MRQPAPGVVEVPGLLCLRCRSAMETVAGWPLRDEEEDVAGKITRHGGATHAAADQQAAVEAVAPAPAAAEVAPPPATLAQTQTAPTEPAPADPVEQVARPAPADPVEQVARPAPADPKSAWLAYAQHLAIDGADDMTKTQLIEAVKAAEAEQADEAG